MDQIFDALELPNDQIEQIGDDRLPSAFAVSPLAIASIGSVGVALQSLLKQSASVSVNARLASLWFDRSIFPIGWELPPIWDAIAGVYQTSDGWIRLHTNLAHHREAAVSVLGCSAERAAVTSAVLNWTGDGLEEAVLKAGGVAARLRSSEDWANHPQGRAVRKEPLIHWDCGGSSVNWVPDKTRPLFGLRVLDLTRVLAGPIATRALAGFGADVLRVDPPFWEEDNVVPDVTLGKKCAGLDLGQSEDRARLRDLIAQAHVLVHGYRPGALDGLGLDRNTRMALNPRLIEVSLCAYGWTGPWADRRGFDSLVQMSTGIADQGAKWAGETVPVPLPVQALDHATGYLMAAAVLRLLAKGGGGAAQLSLARTAELLKSVPQSEAGSFDGRTVDCDFLDAPEITPWGPARRLKPALAVPGHPMIWDRPASNLRTHPSHWA